MSASCFQAPMKRLAKFKSIVKTFNNSLSISPVPLRNSKPLLQMSSGTIAAKKPLKKQFVGEKKEEGKGFVHRRPKFKYSSWDEILSKKYDDMPAKVMNPPLEELSNLAVPHAPIKNSCSKRDSKSGQLMNKKAILTCKRSRNENDCVVDSHLSKKRKSNLDLPGESLRCNSRLSEEEKLEHSKWYRDQTAGRALNDSDVQKAVKRVVLSDSGGETGIIAPIIDDNSYDKGKNTVKLLSRFECIILKSATTDPIQKELERKRLRSKIQVIQDMMTAFKNSQRAAVEVDEASINSILDCPMPPIYTKESYKEAEHIVRTLRRNEDAIVNFRCRNDPEPLQEKIDTIVNFRCRNDPEPLQEKIERELLRGKVKGIEAMMESFRNGNYKKRIAARIALEKKVVKTIEFNDNNMDCMEQLHRLYNVRLFDLNYAPSGFPKPLEWLGLSLKV